MNNKSVSKNVGPNVGPKFGLMLLTAISLFAVTSLVASDDAKSNVPFVRECTNRDAGVWEWGEASDGCDANRFGAVSRIKFVYNEFVFDRSTADNAEQRKDYMTNVNALLRDLSTQYIKARRPDVKDDEVAAFINAIRTVAHQETFWSHYRIAAKGGYKLATGDHNISHGMMQINQRFHASRDQDRSFDLVGNVGFGIEHFYEEWDAASKTKCINRVKNQSREQTLENMTRAAYSSYNGGPGAICRWTNPKHPWAKNDKNYFRKLKAHEWSEWVRTEDQKLKIDLECVRSGDELCAVAQDRKDEYISSRALIMEDGTSCVTIDGKSLSCARDARVFTCLAGLSPEIAAATPLKIKSSDRAIVDLPKKFYDNRLELCAKSFPSLASIGDIVTTQQAIAARNNIGGKTVGFAKKGQSFQILDVDIDLDEKAERHYRVRFPNKVEGWISAGDATTTTTGTLVTIQRMAMATPDAKLAQRWLPTKGAQLEIAKADGLKLLVSPENSAGSSTEVKGQLAKGSTVEVEDVQILGAANEIWLRVRSNSEVGYIYAGRTFPALTVEQWVKVK
ncbi:hypothetical protein BH10BDE1_BH10BDE1_19190 [soil metagenome]